ncbi:MAG: peptidase [Candidatus Kerfeldbacteria bacterium]|nr:peptidase [Candidatus Kerfeldbacteria bacterium]
MNVTPHFLTAGSPKLASGKSRILSLTKKTIRVVTAALPSRHEVDIVYSVNPQATIPEYGIGGYTPNAHTVFISLDPDHQQFAQSVRSQLPRTIAHELHHAVRWLRPGYGITLGEAVVTEGLAGQFELQLFGGQPNPWDVALTGARLQQLLRRAKPAFTSIAYDHRAWFFGDRQARLPRWGGYALGFYLVGRYLANHKRLPSQLVHTPASTILKEANI